VGVNAQAGAIACDDVVILPSSIAMTSSRDTGTPLLDVHTFTRFFTYQLPSDGPFHTNVVQTRFDASKEGFATTQKDLILRLRSSMRSARMDYTG
jgi:hypothetical protein